MQVTLDSAILEHLLERAATASQLLGHIDERASVRLVESAGDHIDEIVHVLSELLGKPGMAAGPLMSPCLPCASDVAAHGDVGTQLVMPLVASNSLGEGAPGTDSATLATGVRSAPASAAGGAR